MEEELLAISYFIVNEAKLRGGGGGREKLKKTVTKNRTYYRGEKYLTVNEAQYLTRRGFIKHGINADTPV